VNSLLDQDQVVHGDYLDAFAMIGKKELDCGMFVLQQVHEIQMEIVFLALNIANLLYDSLVVFSSLEV
jgi:hypothetical protein